MRSGMAHILKGSHSFTCTPRVHPLTEWTIPAFAFPAKAGTHLPTPEGWKAELTWWLVTYRDKSPAPGIEPGYGHPTTTHSNWLTYLPKEAQALPSLLRVGIDPSAEAAMTGSKDRGGRMDGSWRWGCIWEEHCAPPQYWDRNIASGTFFES